MNPDEDAAKLWDDAVKGGMKPDEATAYVTRIHGPPSPPEKEGLGSRVLKNVGGAVKQLVTHPIDTVTGMAKGIATDAADAMLTPEVGERRPDSRAKYGNYANLTQAMVDQPYDAEHGAQPKGNRTNAGLRTAATLAFPAVAGGVTARLGGGALAKGAGLATAGGVAGATQSPDDRVGGALSGAALAPLLGGAGKVAGAGMSRIGSGILDQIGRPLESRPLLQAGPVTVGAIEGVRDRAARLNARDVPNIPANTSGKPLAPVDLGGIPAQRMARGLKTSSPQAETVFREALEPRGDATVQRVIDHAKELTGIKRANAFETHEGLKARTSAEGDASYGKVWGDNGGGELTDPAHLAEIDRLKATPAGAQGWKMAEKMMANDGAAPKVPVPEGYSPEQWADVQKAAQAQGLALPGGSAPTLRELHYWKLALDDLKTPGLNAGEGAGGLGYNMGRSIHGVQKKLLGVMDEASPDYKTARSQFADNKSIEHASALGQEHWTRDPAESAALLKRMTPGEQTLYRDQAFDKWAQRVENGPEDVSKSQAKPLNVARLRSLFPDEASFTKFQEGLKHEATMRATEKGVLSGSTTADKMADMAGLAGVTLPEVLHAATGRVMPLVHGVAGRAIRALSTKQAGTLAAERARLLVAGADGKAGALPVTPSSARPPIRGGPATISAEFGQRSLPDRTPPSQAAQAVRKQVDEMNRSTMVRAHGTKRKY